MTPQGLVGQGLSPELAVFLTSMLPVVELRGALPLAINLFQIPWPKALIISFLGNMIPVPLIILLLGPAVRLLSRIRLFDRFFSWLFERTRRRSNRLIEKYEVLGLFLFVAIPLPMTGAWTGALIAFLFGLDFVKSILVIDLGVIGAGMIVTGLCLLGWVGAVIAGAALILLVVLGSWRL